MGDADEGIVLTDSEREALAGLAESIGDPWLARQLAGQDPGGPRLPPKRRPSWLRAPTLQAVAGRVGMVFLVAGAVLAVTTFMRSAALASLGLGMMGFGLWRVVADRGDQVTRWIASRREGPRPGMSATPPTPPRTPPGAA